MSRQFEHEIQLSGERTAIWRALTDAEELARWLVETAHVEPRVGGAYDLTFDDGSRLGLQIDDWQPAERLRLIGPGPVLQEYTLEDSGGQTVALRVVTSNIPDSPEWDGFFEGGRRGWDLSLRSLQHYVERHAGQTRRLTRRQFDTRLSVDDSWRRARGVADAGELLLEMSGFGLLANVAELDDALLALGVQPSASGSRVWLVLSTYGRAPSGEEFVRRWDRQLQTALDAASSPV